MRNIVSKVYATSVVSVTLFALTAGLNVVAASSNNGDGAAGFFFFMIYCMACLCGLAIGLIIPFFVYKDAVKNEIENPILWAVVTFFFTVPGLLIYLLAIRPDAVKKKEGVK